MCVWHFWLTSNWTLSACTPHHPLPLPCTPLWVKVVSLSWRDLVECLIAQLGVAWLCLARPVEFLLLSHWPFGPRPSHNQLLKLLRCLLLHLSTSFTLPAFPVPPPLVYLLHLLLVVAFLQPLLHGTFGNFFDRFHSHFWLDYASIRNCLSGCLSVRLSVCLSVRGSVCLASWLAGSPHAASSPRLHLASTFIDLLAWNMWKTNTNVPPPPPLSPFLLFFTTKNTTKY